MFEATVGQVLARKSRAEVISIPGDAFLIEALKAMEAHEVGALVVTAGSEVSGLVSERDYVRKAALPGRSPRSTTVQAIAGPAVFVGPEASVVECLALMTRLPLRHLCIEHDGVLLGIISLGDVVKAIAADQAFTIDQLNCYISGSAHEKLPDGVVQSEEGLHRRVEHHA